jgi:hypothetical protein
MNCNELTVSLQRTKIVIRGYTEPPFTQGNPFNMLCVYDTKTTRYVKDKKFFIIDTNTGDITIPRTSDITKIVTKLHIQGYNTDNIVDEPNIDVIQYKPFSAPFDIQKGIVPLNVFQRNSILFLTMALKEKLHVRLLSLPVGKGKTYCALAAIAKYNRKTLIVVPNLVDQWVREICGKTTIDPEKIYTISESIDSVKRLLEYEGTPKYDIYVSTARTLINAKNLDMYIPLCKKLGIGLKIVDEFHIAPYTNAKLDMHCQISETIYLSATALRSSKSEDYVFQLAYKYLPSYGDEMLINYKKYLNCIYVFYDSDPQYYQIHMCTKFYGFDTKAFARHIFSSRCRPIILKIIRWALDLSLNYTQDSDKIVIILELKEHVAALKDVIEKWYPSYTVGDYTSNITKKDKHDMLNSRVILSTNRSFGTGSDLQGKLRVLINTITYESAVTANQLPGRLRDIDNRSVYYIDLVNKGFKRTYEHYNTRAKIINRYAKSISSRTYGVDI